LREEFILETKQAWRVVIGLIAGVIYPVIHAFFIVTNFDFIAILTVILRICLFFTILVMLVIAYRYSVWAKPHGLLKARGDGHSRFAARRGTYETLIAWSPILVPIGVAAVCGYYYVASIPRPDMIGFTASTRGLAYWLVIGGILVGFAYVVLKPVIKTLKPSREPRQPRIKGKEPSEQRQQITPLPIMPAKPIDKQEPLQSLSSNTAEGIKCLACGYTSPASSKECQYCRSPL
jgi:hypothetical protein